jgi:hypothetical protein
MTEQNDTGQAPLDQHILYLINRCIDGEISSKEQEELDRLLKASPAVRDLHDELKEVTRLLDEVPEIDPPGYLKDTIERQVRLPAKSPPSPEKSGLWGRNWLGSNWLRTGFALAAGVVLSVGIYEMGSEPINTRDGSNMVGTMAKRAAVEKPGTLLDSVQLNTANLNGLIELRNKDDFYTLDLQLNSAKPTGVVIDFAGRGLEFEGFRGGQVPGEGVSVVDGSIHLASNKEQKYVVIFKRNSTEQMYTALDVGFVTDDEMFLRAELNISN